MGSLTVSHFLRPAISCNRRHQGQRWHMFRLSLGTEGRLPPTLLQILSIGGIEPCHEEVGHENQRDTHSQHEE